MNALIILACALSVVLFAVLIGVLWWQSMIRSEFYKYARPDEYEARERRRHERRGWMLCLTGRKGELKLRRS
jgi:uncharacterized iron-regulated membrane protein